MSASPGLPVGVGGARYARSASETAGNRSWWERACEVTPGGVNSPVRAFKAVGGDPYFVTSGEGPHVWDADGNRYVDYVQSYGASILGHAHPLVVEAARRAAGRGTTFGAPTPGEVALAEEIASRVPGCEQVRLVSSGTEAAMSAVRLARGATGRDRVVVFSGCYHGHSDGLLAGGGSGVASLGLPASAGVTKAAVADTLVVPYNSVPEVGADVAAVIVEPVAANMGLVPPAPGFLAGLREACTHAGAILIFDEVITGFRVGRGGASALFGVTPDLWCFGKVVGGGFPLAAFAGRRDLMGQLAPGGPVYQAGTLSGNPVATAAGLAVLSLLDEAGYEKLSAFAGRLGAGLAATAEEAGLQVQVPVAGPLVGIFFTPVAVQDFEGARASAATGLYPPVMRGLLRRGVAIAPGPYEILFPSLAHGEAELDATLSAFAEVAREVVAGAR
ncbi:MAG: glutamate-1-semialdehyde 2,1-aminomutase [Acidimicrobiales bacterium]